VTLRSARNSGGASAADSPSAVGRICERETSSLSYCWTRHRCSRIACSLSRAGLTPCHATCCSPPLAKPVQRRRAWVKRRNAIWWQTCHQRTVGRENGAETGMAYGYVRVPRHQLLTTTTAAAYPSRGGTPLCLTTLPPLHLPHLTRQKLATHTMNICAFLFYYHLFRARKTAPLMPHLHTASHLKRRAPRKGSAPP